VTATVLLSASVFFGALLILTCLTSSNVHGPWGSLSGRAGTIHVFCGDDPVQPGRSPVLLRMDLQGPRLAPDWHAYPAKFDAAGSMITPSWWFVRAPLWIPTAAFMIPAFVMAVNRRPRRQTWQCRGCGYDLRGLTDGVRCPECGRSMHPMDDRDKQRASAL